MHETGLTALNVSDNDFPHLNLVSAVEVQDRDKKPKAKTEGVTKNLRQFLEDLDLLLMYDPIVDTYG